MKLSNAASCSNSESSIPERYYQSRFHPDLGALFTSPEPLFTCPESLFTSPESVSTSSRNSYSHRSGIPIHMPRNMQLAGKELINSAIEVSVDGKTVKCIEYQIPTK